MLLVGAYRLGRPSLTTVALFLPTYPLILFFDVFAAALGAVDLALGREAWGQVRRSATVETQQLPREVASLLSAESRGANVARALAAILLLGGMTVAVNDLLVVDNCGHPKYLFGDAILHRKRDFDTELTVLIEKRPGRPGHVAIEAEVQIKVTEGRAVSVSATVDGETEAEHRFTEPGRFEVTREVPAGFETVNIGVAASGAGSSCWIERSVPTTLKEIRDRQLHLNGEPFLIKGVIPSFRKVDTGLELREGLQQIKRLGANTVRVYHAPTPELVALAAELQLMLIVQPDESTWQNIDMTNEDSAEGLARRYRELVAASEASPYILIDNLGNELELTTQGFAAPRNIARALRQARADPYYRFPL
ncbi:MAG: hypothetical protein AAGA56_13490, partial [Myxococcota bacterium]